MFKRISWFIFFTYIGICLLLYYTFVLIYYYRKELSNFRRRRSSKDHQVDYPSGRINAYQSGPLGRSVDYSYSFQNESMDDRSIVAPNAERYERIEAEESQSDNRLSNKENLEGVDEHMLDIQEAEPEPEDLHMFNEEKTLPVKKIKSPKTDIKSRHDSLFEDVNVNELMNITE